MTLSCQPAKRAPLRQICRGKTFTWVRVTFTFNAEKEGLLFAPLASFSSAVAEPLRGKARDPVHPQHQLTSCSSQQVPIPWQGPFSKPFSALLHMEAGGSYLSYLQTALRDQTPQFEVSKPLLLVGTNPIAQAGSKFCSPPLDYAEEAKFYPCAAAGLLGQTESSPACSAHTCGLAEQSPASLGMATGTSMAWSPCRAGVMQRHVVKSISLPWPQTQQHHLPQNLPTSPLLQPP